MNDRMVQETPVVARVAFARFLRSAGIVAGLALAVPGVTSGQSIPNITAPIEKAHKAADATNRNISEQTGQALPGKQAKAPDAAPISGPGSVPNARSGVSASPRALSTSAPGPMQPVTREIFAYEPEGRRDPFFSLILTEELRPLLSDLKLVAILYASSGRGSVAIMRDVLTNAQYRVNTGQTLGRMRVAQIKQRAVIFTIDEFGLSRQDSLFLVDSTKVRIR